MSHCEISANLDGLKPVKLIDILRLKSAQLRDNSADAQQKKVVVCNPNPRKRNRSWTLSVKIESKRSGKEVKRELEQGSSQPITNFFRKKEQNQTILQKERAKTKVLKNFKISKKE